MSRTARPAGRFSARDSDSVLVVLHGLGGSCDSLYIRAAANAALERGLSVLRLNLRGADRQCPDFYHAGLTVDLRSALASPALAPFDHVYLLGFSLGGHVGLRYASEAGVDPRLRGLVSACAPLDLSGCADELDRPAMAVYRRYILRHLVEMYGVVARHREVSVTVEKAARIRHMREWDERIVAPRHGFAGAADYYSRASVGPRLGRISARTLVLAAENDPMIPAGTLRPYMNGVRPPVEARWVARGGHLGFSRAFDLGLPGPTGFERQVLSWLQAVEE